MDVIYYSFIVLLFAACIFLFEGVWLWWTGTYGGGAQRIARRLKLMSARDQVGSERVSILKQRRYSTSDAIDKLLRSLPKSAALDTLIVQSGLKLSVAQFITASLVMCAIGLLLALNFAAAPVLLLVLPASLMGLPYLMLLRARTARLKKIEGQLPDTADFLGRALRAGHSFANVLQMAGEELPDPIGGEFKFSAEEIVYGVSMNQSMHNLAARIPLTDLRYLVIAVLIQRESGGNLAEILGNISIIIRKRLKLLGQIRTLTAEGKMSAWILGLLPFVVVLVMSITSPDYISELWIDPKGIRLLWFAAGMLIVGLFWMRKVIRIRV